MQQDITAHSVLKLQPAARAVLRGENSLSLAVPRLQSVKREPERLTKQQYDRALFAKLKALRKHIAQRDDVPPFVVFSDASLIEMSQQLPTDSRSLLAISGVGQTQAAHGLCAAFGGSEGDLDRDGLAHAGQEGGIERAAADQRGHAGRCISHAGISQRCCSAGLRPGHGGPQAGRSQAFQDKTSVIAHDGSPYGFLSGVLAR